MPLVVTGPVEGAVDGLPSIGSWVPDAAVEDVGVVADADVVPAVEVHPLWQPFEVTQLCLNISNHSRLQALRQWLQHLLLRGVTTVSILRTTSTIRAIRITSRTIKIRAATAICSRCSRRVSLAKRFCHCCASGCAASITVVSCVATSAIRGAACSAVDCAIGVAEEAAVVWSTFSIWRVASRDKIVDGTRHEIVGSIGFKRLRIWVNGRFDAAVVSQYRVSLPVQVRFEGSHLAANTLHAS